MNIIEQQQLLEAYPDNALLQEGQAPSGQFPQYLVVAELQRRSDLRQRYQAQQQAKENLNKPTVLEQKINELAGIPSVDRGAMQGPPQQDPRAMAGLPQMAGPQMPQQPPQQPPRGMAAGGLVGGEDPQRWKMLAQLVMMIQGREPSPDTSIADMEAMLSDVGPDMGSVVSSMYGPENPNDMSRSLMEGGRSILRGITDGSPVPHPTDPNTPLGLGDRGGVTWRPQMDAPRVPFGAHDYRDYQTGMLSDMAGVVNRSLQRPSGLPEDREGIGSLYNGSTEARPEHTARPGWRHQPPMMGSGPGEERLSPAQYARREHTPFSGWRHQSPMMGGGEGTRPDWTPGEVVARDFDRGVTPEQRRYRERSRAAPNSLERLNNWYNEGQERRRDWTPEEWGEFVGSDDYARALEAASQFGSGDYEYPFIPEVAEQSGVGQGGVPDMLRGSGGAGVSRSSSTSQPGTRGDVDWLRNYRIMRDEKLRDARSAHESQLRDLDALGSSLGTSASTYGDKVREAAGVTEQNMDDLAELTSSFIKESSETEESLLARIDSDESLDHQRKTMALLGLGTAIASGNVPQGLGALGRDMMAFNERKKERNDEIMLKAAELEDARVMRNESLQLEAVRLGNAADQAVAAGDLERARVIHDNSVSMARAAFDIHSQLSPETMATINSTAMTGAIQFAKIAADRMSESERTQAQMMISGLEQQDKRLDSVLRVLATQVTDLTDMEREASESLIAYGDEDSSLRMGLEGRVRMIRELRDEAREAQRRVQGHIVDSLSGLASINSADDVARIVQERSEILSEADEIIGRTVIRSGSSQQGTVTSGQYYQQNPVN